MLKTIALLPGITLRCYFDTRFKQGCLSVQFIRPMCRQEASYNALLPAVLLRGTASAPDLRDITLHLDDLYGASVGAVVRRIGDYQTTGLYASFIDDQFALEEDCVLSGVMAFLGDLLFRPRLEQGVFLQEYVESEKTNLISAIESQLNNKQAYANANLLKLMCKEDSFGIPRLGEAENVKEITAESLYRHYQKLLQESPIELFYVGSGEPEQIAAMLKPMFANLDRTPLPLSPQTAFHTSGTDAREDVMDVSQGKLAMGFVTPITNRSSQFAAMQLCNIIFGGGMTSKLFTQVREAMHLCYDISSGYHGAKGILIVSAGIDSENKDLVCAEVQKQLALCAAGEITAEELTAAKQALFSGLRGVHDAPGSIENYYATAALSGLNMTPEEYQKAIAQVTLEQVSEAAKTLTCHCIYFLKGVQE